MKRLHDQFRFRTIPILSALAVIFCASVSASDQPKEDAGSCPAIGQCLKMAVKKLVGQIFTYPTKFSLATIEQLGAGGRQQIYTNALGQPINTGPGRLDMENLGFTQHSPILGQLNQMEELSLVTFWESSSAKLYLGIGKTGIAGINFRVKRHQRASPARTGQWAERPQINDPYRLISIF